MDITKRKITKIAREAEKLVLVSLREEGVGTAEIDLIHALRQSSRKYCTLTKLQSREGRKILKQRAISSAQTLRTTAEASSSTQQKKPRN